MRQLSIKHALAVFALALIAGCATGSPTAEEVLLRANGAPPGETAFLEAWLADNADAPADQRAQVFSELCDAHGRVGRYAAAAEACAQSAAASAETPEGLAQSIAFWRGLAGERPLSVTGSFDEPLTYGWTGMGEVAVTANGVTAGWGVDTGAEVSVLRVSDAMRFGARHLNGELGITGSTPGVAAGQLAMIDVLRIGDAEVRDVPVFVVPDESMTHGENVVPPILGMPVLYAFGRVEFAQHGARIRSRPTLTDFDGDIRWNDAGISIPIRLSGGDVRVHLDTGANATELHDSQQRLLSPAQRAALVSRTSSFAGVSGVIQREVHELSGVAIGVGAARCPVERLTFGEEEAGAQGRAGIDLVKACETFALDFMTMRVGARN